MQVSVGDVFRDTYHDRHSPNLTKRTIEVIEVVEAGIHAKVLTNCDGSPTEGRQTRLSFKTLSAGYERVRGAA